MAQPSIHALGRKGTKNLLTISNNMGVDGVGNGRLLAAGQIQHHIGTYVGENKLLEEMVLKGLIKLDLVPQGTFSERIRAGDAGIPAFFTPTGVGTVVAEGKETREFDGRRYLMERALNADFAFVKDVYPAADWSEGVDTIVTERAYIRVTEWGLVLEEVAPGFTAEDVQRATEAKLIVSPTLGVIKT